jgi:hypothetical protein
VGWVEPFAKAVDSTARLMGFPELIGADQIFSLRENNEPDTFLSSGGLSLNLR